MQEIMPSNGLLEGYELEKEVNVDGNYGKGFTDQKMSVPDWYGPMGWVSF